MCSGAGTAYFAIKLNTSISIPKTTRPRKMKAVAGRRIRLVSSQACSQAASRMFIGTPFYILYPEHLERL